MKDGLVWFPAAHDAPPTEIAIAHNGGGFTNLQCGHDACAFAFQQAE